MATLPRAFVRGQYYHVYNRGNHKESIFFEDFDYRRFLRKFSTYRADYPVTVLAFCLMPNHYHFLLRQDTDTSISGLFSRLQNSHAKFLNVKYGFVGSSFQNPFQAKFVDRDEYLIHLSRYIHINPLDLVNDPLSVDGKVQWLMNYQWSSLKTYLRSQQDKITDTSFIFEYRSFKGNPEKYQDFVADGIAKPNFSLISQLTLDNP